MRRQDENDEVIGVITEKAKVRPDIITNTILADISRSLAVIADVLTENNNKEFKENTNHISWSDLSYPTTLSVVAWMPLPEAYEKEEEA